MPNLSINKHYNFSVYANSILGTSFSNTKLVSILDYSTALKFANIELLHKQVYPYLPPDTISDFTKYQYFLFKHKNKDLVLADVWIDDTTIEETLGLSYTLKLNNINSSQLSIISNQLRLLGVSFDVID